MLGASYCSPRLVHWLAFTVTAACSGGGGASHRDAGKDSAPEAVPPGSGDAGDTPAAPMRGAALPYFEYEAEEAATNGTVIGRSRTFGDVAAEASGRRAVRLDAEGQYVRFAVTHPANSIVVRYSVPDPPAGGGASTTIGVFVDGVRKASLPLMSRYSYTYGDADACLGRQRLRTDEQRLEERRERRVHDRRGRREQRMVRMRAQPTTSSAPRAATRAPPGTVPAIG